MEDGHASTETPAAEHFRFYFEIAPAAALVLDPSFRILAVSDRYLELTMKRRDEVVGRPVFDVFPEDSDDPADGGREALRASLERVLRDGSPDTMPPLRHDVPRPADRGGGFDVRWWVPRNVPVIDEAGAPYAILHSVEDITVQRRMEEEMAEALRENRRILEHSRDLLAVVDESGRFVRLSDAAERILGYAPSEMIGRPFIDFVHPEDRAASLEARSRVKSGSPVSTFRNRLRRKDGAVVPLMWSSVWMPDERMSYAVGRDVTELVEAEREITRLGNHLATTLESISQACFTVDREWRFVYMNRQFEEFVERSREDLIGTVLWDEFPDGLHSPYLAHYRRAMEERVKVSFEAHVPQRGQWFEVTAHPTPDGIAILFRDITIWKFDAQRLEEQAAAIDQAQEAIIIRHLDHTVRSWNASAERLYGYSAEEAIGRPIDSLLHTDLEKFSSANEVLLSEGRWSGELELKREDGGTMIVDARWSLLRGKDGRPDAILAIHSDLTERKEIEAQFLRAQRLESLGRLAGGIAHDLNNVLAPVLMGVSLLREVVGSDRLVMETLDAMESSANRGADMVQQVLLFARGVEGRRARVSLDEVIGQVRRMMEDTFPKGIRLEVSGNEAIWPVLGDATQLHQVLLNLCVNARDALPRERGTIRIEASNVEVDEQYASMNLEASAGCFVCIEVSDSGSGIPPDIIEHVFEPFFTTKGVGSGTGLGLATVQGIVKSHGGWIDVYSEPGEGTVFRLYLPADLGGAQSVDPGFESEVPRGRGELVLVVDDEASIRTITRHTLESFGYRVMTAGDGAEAIALYSRHQEQVDVVLTDMMMPVMDGIALIHALHHLNPQARIIAASGLGANGSITRAEGEGVEDFLPKPYTSETMLRLVRKVLDATAHSGAGRKS